jgi:hypothetical protein
MTGLCLYSYWFVVRKLSDGFEVVLYPCWVGGNEIAGTCGDRLLFLKVEGYAKYYDSIYMPGGCI